ncbi:uncharacterized protein LOC115926809 [Strongylocentrotus purpuratus]|uniref:Secreted protein n=1 Tax=Strongylocentrotus purpuratus TaxID=7668 RepID=A0A7M7P9I4_STRPU|nr:uncharacterized protein LOC115926809 [Strongylocentrotus purpuratus]
MATTMKLTVALCLIAVSYFTFSEAFPRQSINDHLIKSCLGYKEKKRGEGHRCNPEVLDHVHDFAEGVQRAGPGYNGDLVEKFLKQADNNQLCYLEGSELRKVVGGCAAMELVCDAFTPRVVDECSTLRNAIPPPTLPTTTQRPQTAAPTAGMPAPRV